MKHLQRIFQQIQAFIGSWSHVLRFVWHTNPGLTLVLIIFTVLHGVLPSVQIQVTSALAQSVVDALGHRHAPDALYMPLFFAALQGGLLITLSVLSIGQQWIQTLLQLQLSNAMSIQVMEKALTLDMSYFEDDVFYDKLQRANRESSMRSYQMFIQLNALGTQVITLISVASLLFSWNWKLGLLVLFSPLPSIVSQLWFGQRGYLLEKERSPRRRMLTYLQSLVTSAQSYKEIRLFRLGEYFLQRYRDIYRDFYLKDNALAKRQFLLLIPLEVFSNLVVLGAQVYAIFASFALGGIGVLIGYIQAVTIAQSSISSLLTLVSQLYQSHLFIGNLFEFFDVPARPVQSGLIPFPVILRKGIEFRNVSFYYPGKSQMVLRNISFFLPAGKTVALVGKNGSGKTTIVKLLTRLYEPTAGQILIDDLPLSAYDVEDLRAHIGILFQDFVHYEMSARDNIGFGALEELTNERRIRNAAEVSGIAPVIEELPQGYATTLGRTFEDGYELSGGQWQKVGLARVFMRAAPLIILDEPTAAIDARAEAEIFDQLRCLAAGTTTLLIAHRFSTLRLADHIIVLEQGHIIEEGSHQQLMQINGSYAYLFNLQAAGYKDLPEEKVTDIEQPPKKKLLKRLFLQPLHRESDIA